MNSPLFQQQDVPPTIVCLIILGIAITYTIIFVLVQRDSERRRSQRLDEWARVFNLERLPGESNGDFQIRIMNAIKAPHYTGRRQDAKR